MGAGAAASRKWFCGKTHTCSRIAGGAPVWWISVHGLKVKLG